MVDATRRVEPISADRRRPGRRCRRYLTSCRGRSRRRQAVSTTMRQDGGRRGSDCGRFAVRRYLESWPTLPTPRSHPSARCAEPRWAARPPNRCARTSACSARSSATPCVSRTVTTSSTSWSGRGSGRSGCGAPRSTAPSSPASSTASTSTRRSRSSGPSPTSPCWPTSPRTSIANAAAPSTSLRVSRRRTAAWPPPTSSSSRPSWTRRRSPTRSPARWSRR